MLCWWCLIITQGPLAGSGVSDSWQEYENLFREKYSECCQMQQKGRMKMAKIRQNCANSAQHEPCGQGSSNATVFRSSVLTCTRCCQHSISHLIHIWYCIKGAPLQLVEVRLNGPIPFCGGEYKSWSGGAEINSFHRPPHPVKQKPLNSKWKKIHREWIWLS